MQNHYKISLYFTGFNIQFPQVMYLERILKELSNTKKQLNAFVPGLWLDRQNIKPREVDFVSFLILRINAILEKKGQFTILPSEAWTSKAIVYNIFIRFFSAYDHDQDGEIGQQTGDITLNSKGVRETGTFLKTITLLPYLRKLGVNTIHLLPITEIGTKGRKGNMGSPYAIKNPFKINPLLADPIINIPVDKQYKALVEAAHILGMRVVQEFIFRTTAIDSDWIKEHPEWFYWIKNNVSYGPPKFNANDLKHIMKVPEGKGKYIPPYRSYQAKFIIPPKRADGNNRNIASAFADWPPNDLQPPWSDVTYLRLFNYDYERTHNYNYIAYNTIRFYDPELARKENINRDLWETITNIIPYYQKNFDIDGAMIDMGHALPTSLKKEIIRKAREINPFFAFWDENFDNKIQTKKDGYDAVIGDAWYRITKREGIRKLIGYALSNQPLPFFGAAETHNSPRFGSGNINKKKASWLLFNVLPGAIPFIHNGFELDERQPVNTGLNFSKKEIDHFADKPLALFNKSSLNWDSQRNIIPFIEKVQEIKAKYPWVFNGKKLSALQTSNKKVLGYAKKHSKSHIVILFNTNFYGKEAFEVEKNHALRYKDLLSNMEYDLSKGQRFPGGKVILGKPL